MRAQYNNQLLQLFTSSLFIAGLLAGLVATVPTRHLGRRATMLVSCLPCHCSCISSWQACPWAPVLPDWLGPLFLTRLDVPTTLLTALSSLYAAHLLAMLRACKQVCESRCSLGFALHLSPKPHRGAHRACARARADRGRRVPAGRGSDRGRAEPADAGVRAHLAGRGCRLRQPGARAARVAGILGFRVRVAWGGAAGAKLARYR